jgi:preprotein translocase subunit SecD
MDSLPPEWTTEQLGSTSAVFRNDEYELSLKIEPRYRSSASRRRARTQEIKSYRVKAVQDWFSKGVYGDQSMRAKVDTWDEALTTAQEFMEEFSKERTDRAPVEVEATHRSVGDAGTAERLLTTEASAEALADASGYTDELLLDVLGAETNNQYRVVAHRDGEQIEYVYGTDDDCLETLPLEGVYATFSVDKLGLEALLTDASDLVSTINIDEYVVYRFIANDRQETALVLTRGTQVASPSFERTLWNVLEEKW